MSEVDITSEYPLNEVSKLAKKGNYVSYFRFLALQAAVMKNT